MSFRIRDLEAIVLAGLVFGILPLAKAQSTSGDHIVYSSPQGKVTPATPPPMVQPPQPEELEIPSDNQINANIFAEPEPEPMFPAFPPAQLLNNAQKQDDLTDPMGIRKELGVQTAAEMMNVPTAEQIFGLPERNSPDALTKPSDSTTGDTNGFVSETTIAAGWTNMWSGSTGVINSNRTERASGFFGGFFDSAQNDNGFGNHDWGSAETSFAPPQASGEQEKSWDAALSAGTPPATVVEPQNNFSWPNSASSEGFSSQSPFLPPQVSSQKALPQLPTLPSLPGRKVAGTQPPTTPSWAPKPPPWTQAQTPFGTPVQLNLHN